MKAIYNGKTIAESQNTKVVEGNHYFPPDSINEEYFTPSGHTTTCHWKGVANYKNIEVEGKVNKNGAWQYNDPKPAASGIKGYYAFWNGVETTG